MCPPLDSNWLSWTSLLAHWMDLARAARALDGQHRHRCAPEYALHFLGVVAADIRQKGHPEGRFDSQCALSHFGNDVGIAVRAEHICEHAPSHVGIVFRTGIGPEDYVARFTVGTQAATVHQGDPKHEFRRAVDDTQGDAAAEAVTNNNGGR